MNNFSVRKVTTQVGLLFVMFMMAITASPSAASPLPPYSYTGAASNVTYSSAILYGHVNAHGQETNYTFQYGTTAGYGAQTPLAAAGNGAVEVRISQAVGGLQAGTTYHYRLVATNPGGTTNGRDRTFTTPKVPLSVQITSVPNPVTFGSSLFVEGALSGTGASTREVILQINQFPYTGGFQTVGSPEVENSLGTFSFPVLSLSRNTQLRVLTVGLPAVYSPIVTEHVAVRVTFHARRTRRHGVVRLYGTVTPAEADAAVGFQLLTPGHRSINEGGTRVEAGTTAVSRFSRRVHLRHRGIYRALVLVSDNAHVSAYSDPIFVR